MNALELRRRTLGKGVYKKTVEGNPAIAQGSLARRYPGITMQGWTEQNQYDGKNILDTFKKGEEDSEYYSVNEYGELTQLKQDNRGGISVKSITDFDIGTYYFYLFTSGVSFQVFNAETGSQLLIQEKIGFTQLTFDSHTKIAYKVFNSSQNASNVQVMISKSQVSTYEPYTGGQPSPNPDYPQEIISAGKYDEGTGKYQYTIKISDSEESPTKSQTVTLTSDRPLTKWDKLEKRNGQWGWVYKSAEIVLDGSEDEAWTLYTTSATGVISFYTTLYGGIGAMKSSLCDKYINKNYAWNDESLYGIYTDDTSYPGRKYFRPPSAEIETVEQWKTWLSENPLTVWYETAEETFVPLSESEQEAMNEMYTFRPTTVLSNDCECEMTLTYKTKKSLEVTD